MKAILAVIITILTSLFFFPFNCSLMPSINTKLALSLVGMVLLGFESTQNRNAEIDRTFMSVSGWAILVSAAGLLSVLINGTNDYTYALYFISVWVWLAAAYVVIKVIDWTYGKVTLRLVANFLIVVCVSQCILSQIIEKNAAIDAWVRGFIVSEGFMGIPVDRLFGIGCALDVAGLKFSCVLVLLAYFSLNPSGRMNPYVETSLYVIAFMIITVLGSMISRTTSVGAMFAIGFWCISPLIYSGRNKSIQFRYLLLPLIIALTIIIPLSVYQYNTDVAFHKNLRFGFEGFFSLIETGKWEVNSNEMMMSMWVWPDKLETWIIGDGYFSTPKANPYYMGPDYGDFYMGTDIGYCRFVFYFGILGLLTFCGFFLNAAYQCSKHNPQAATVFWIILIINFIGWAKVSSDIFPVYAIMLYLGRERSSHNEPNKLELSRP